MTTDGNDGEDGTGKADLGKARTIPLEERASLVDASSFARPVGPGLSVRELMARMPAVLRADDLRAVALGIAGARKRGRPVVLAFGGHVIKTGLAPIIIDLMERKVLTAIAINGAAAIHDMEIAMVGRTSEDVERYIRDGLFGMARETGEMLNGAAREGRKDGFGAALGERALGQPNSGKSVLAAAHRLGVPLTVHVTIGADIVHSHPSADGGAIGEATMTDFKKLTNVLSELDGGVYINMGSAVVMPEVFVKALNLARNLGHKVDDFIAVNMDMIQHYRPTVNVVKRPTAGGGMGYSLTGHHEIMFPLLAAAVLDEMEEVE